MLTAPPVALALLPADAAAPSFSSGLNFEPGNSGHSGIESTLPWVLYGRHPKVDAVLGGIVGLLQRSVSGEVVACTPDEYGPIITLFAELKNFSFPEIVLYQLVKECASIDNPAYVWNVETVADLTIVARTYFSRWALSAAHEIAEKVDALQLTPDDSIPKAVQVTAKLQEFGVYLTALSVLSADHRFDSVYLLPVLGVITSRVCDYLNVLRERTAEGGNEAFGERIITAARDQGMFLRGLADARVPAWLEGVWKRECPDKSSADSHTFLLRKDTRIVLDAAGRQLELNADSLRRFAEVLPPSGGPPVLRLVGGEREEPSYGEPAPPLVETTGTAEVSVLAAFNHLFGFSGFRPHQFELIQSALDGVDQLVILPTAAGKSYVQWYAAETLKSKGITIFIQPTIAILDWHTSTLVKLGFRAARLHSQMPIEEQQAVMVAVRAGEITVLNITPERAVQKAFQQNFETLNVVRIVVDEAQSFHSNLRPAYRGLRQARAAFGNPAISILAGSLTLKAQAEITEHLGLRNPHRVVESVVRPNIDIETRQYATGPEKRAAIIAEVTAALSNPGMVFVYSATIGDCVAIADALAADHHGPIHLYHGEMEGSERQAVMTAVAEGKCRVLCATTAAAYGIDPQNVQLGILNGVFTDLRVIAQMLGRLGRNGEQVKALLCHTVRDIGPPLYFLTTNHPSPELVDHVAKKLYIWHSRKKGLLHDINWQKFYDEYGEEGSIPRAMAEAAVRVLIRSGRIELIGSCVAFEEHPGAIPDGEHFVRKELMDAAREEEFDDLRQVVAFLRAPAGQHWPMLQRHFDGTPAVGQEQIDLDALVKPSRRDVHLLLRTLAGRVFERGHLINVLRGEEGTDTTYPCHGIFRAYEPSDVRLELLQLRIARLIRVGGAGSKRLIFLGAEGVGVLDDEALDGDPLMPAKTAETYDVLKETILSPPNYYIVREAVINTGRVPTRGSRHQQKKWCDLAEEFWGIELSFFDDRHRVQGSHFLADCFRLSGYGQVDRVHARAFLTHFFADEIPAGTFDSEIR